MEEPGPRHSLTQIPERGHQPASFCPDLPPAAPTCMPPAAPACIPSTARSAFLLLHQRACCTSNPHSCFNNPDTLYPYSSFRAFLLLCLLAYFLLPRPALHLCSVYVMQLRSVHSHFSISSHYSKLPISCCSCLHPTFLASLFPVDSNSPIVLTSCSLLP